jgi:hypothetical protein
MRQDFIICILAILTACSSNEKKNTPSDTSTNIPADNFALDEQPAKTIIDFLKWYRDNENKVGGGWVNNASNETYDSTKFYSVNFEATEKYLTELKLTGFISDKYIDKWREYFKKCDKDFKDNPSNDGPPEGFEYDLIMLSQETEENLKHLEKTQVVESKITDNTALLNLHFINGDNMQYKLTKDNDKWLIDDIERK